MALSNLVKVSNIKDLSNARYCAGMGVELLGFDTDTMSIETFSEIKNWVTGIKIVAETSLTTLEELELLLEKFQPDYIQLPSAEGLEHFFVKNNVLCISETEADAALPFVAFVKTNHTTVAKCMLPYHVFEKLPAQQQQTVAIELIADSEQRPGFSNFDTIMDALEALETED
jgi:phosphoribosylanthranilate isomerase